MAPAPAAPAAATAPAPTVPATTAVVPQTGAGPDIKSYDIVAVVLYFFVLGWLGWIAYKKSRTAEEYLVAGREIHPVIMALSYGSTFISTSAIVGFGGVAGCFGMSLLWLTFLNIFVGIFIAFAVLGAPIRRMGQHLGAHTFPEFLGKRYDSNAIQVVAGSIIFIFMPIYIAAVMLGGVKFLKIQFGIEYSLGILILGVVVAPYVIAGGLRGVMYTGAFQAVLMFVGMVLLLYFAYDAAGGFVAGHRALADLAGKIDPKLKAAGITSFAAMPVGFSQKWWLLVSTLVLGVGIGVLAQPQLAVRFMTVKSDKQINRACAVGGVFILAMTGAAFVVGALSNVYFDAKFGKLAGAMAVTAGGASDVDLIIPTFVKHAMPRWFGTLFFLTLLCAAMSTLSSQFHAMGAAIGRDVYERLFRRGEAKADAWTRIITQIGIAVAVVISLILSWKYAAKPVMIIAKATSIFFALCASTFLPSLLLGLFWRRMNRQAAMASIFVGFFFTAFWLTCMQADIAKALPVTGWLFGLDEKGLPKQASLVAAGSLPNVDALVFALPLSFVVAFVVALCTRPMSVEHLDRCFTKKRVAQWGL